MTESQYGIIKPKSTLSHMALLRVPHRGRLLEVGDPPFGPNKYEDNKKSMKERRLHAEIFQEMTFRPLTTSESISVLAYNFRNEGVPKIIDSCCLQLGRHLRTQEGVYANLPNDAQGNPITDLEILKKLLDKTTKIRHGKGNIYLGDNDFGYAEYETFKRGIQSICEFTTGGLAIIS